MRKRKIIWIIISFCIAIASIWMVIQQSENFDLVTLLNHIKGMNKGWLILSLVCMFGFIWIEGITILRIVKTLDPSIQSKSGTTYAAADVYFSAITPSASGGQPASAYFMIRDGMKTSVVTITLLLNLMLYSLALVFIGIVCFIFWGEVLWRVSVKFKILFFIGSGILVGSAILFYLLIRKEQIIDGCANSIITALERWKIIKDGKTRREKIHNSMLQYKRCAVVISQNKKMLLDAFVLNVAQRLSQIVITFNLFMGCGKGLTLSIKATIMQAFVVVGSNSVPIPGAMGVADYMMLNGFTMILGETEATHMELLCRGITFYGCILTGGILTAIGYIRRRRKERIC